MTMATAGDEKAKFPYMPFYVDDWLSSDAVGSFTLEQQAAYFRLLLRQWKAKDGTLPKDETILARWSGLGTRWKKLGRPILDRCFVKREDGWVNPKCRELWNYTHTRSAKARQAADLRWELERTRQTSPRQRARAIWEHMRDTYNRCLRCGRSGIPLDRDHIIPRYQGGDDTPQNWQPLCARCNASKGPDRTDHRVGLPETDPAWLPCNGNGEER